MKRMILAIAMVAMVVCAKAQEVTPSKDCYIEVTGFAEKELTPDTFYLSILLDESELSSRTTLAEREAEMIAEFKRVGIDTSKLKITTMAVEIESRRRADSAIKYQIELTSEQQLVSVLRILDQVKANQVQLERTTCSKMDEMRQIARHEAILNAKSVAQNYATDLGQSLGACFYVRDNSNDYIPQGYTERLYSTRGTMSDNSVQKSTQPLELQAIKIQYRVDTKFYLLAK